MIQVKFVGGAKKSFPSEFLEIDKSNISLQELLSLVLQKKSQSTPTLDVANILLAVNGVDSSALNGKSTILKDNDVVSIIPIIHGGSSKSLRLTILKRHVLAVEIQGKKSTDVHVLEELRKNFPKIKLQAISSKFILDKYHLEKMISLSIHSEKHRMLLSNKLETDLLMRFAISGQISDAIKTAGIKPNQSFFLIAIGGKRDLDNFFKKMPYGPAPIFTNDNSSFLKKHFHLTQKQLDSVYSKNPLADMLVERAATLF